MACPKPAIPADVVARWQRVIDILARLVEVPAGLIMKAEPPRHHVFIASRSEGNPYTTDVSFELETGLYCDRVIADRSLLIVPDATVDQAWDKNPDLKHGMVFYMGYPLQWPDGSLFGTICVLDRQDNEKARHYVDLLKEFTGVVESDLKLLVELEIRKRVERELQTARDHLEARVEERTQALSRSNEELRLEIARRTDVERALRTRETELEETNTALKVLLRRLEDSKQEMEDRILWNLREQIMPYLESLKRIPLDTRSRTYLSLLETNLRDIAAQFPNRLSTTFSSLTPTELEVAKLIRQGKSTKEIAAFMSIATSTIDFHRSNIRRKVGIASSRVNLRTYLTSLG